MSHFKFTGATDKSLDCSICYSTMLRPVTLSCGHSSCQKCLANLVASKPKPACPVCRTEFASDATLNVNITLNLTSKLGVACTNSGCTWTGTSKKTEEHSKNCPKQKVNCVNEGCHHMLTRVEINSHIVACTKQKIPCVQCGMSTTRESLPHHLATLCSHNIIPCPLSCGEMLQRYQVTLHLSKCGEKAVQCTVSGCHTIFRRMNFDNHVATAASSYMVLQAGEVERLQRILYHKYYNMTPTIELKERSTTSFRWVVENFNQYVDSTIASPCFVSVDRQEELLPLSPTAVSSPLGDCKDQGGSVKRQ